MPGVGRSPGEGNGYPLQYSGLKNSTDRGAWQATGLGSNELDTTQQLSNNNNNSYKTQDGRPTRARKTSFCAGSLTPSPGPK